VKETDGTSTAGQQTHVASAADTTEFIDAFRGDAAQAYDVWYEHPDNRTAVDLERKALLEMMAPAEGESLLDVGCGTGYFSFYFYRQGLKVVGLDRSKDMLAVAREKRKDLPLVLGDAHRLPFDEEAFDITTAITTLEFISNPDVVLHELYRVCKRMVVLGVLHKLSWLALKRRIRRRSPFPRATFYTAGDLEKLIRHSLGNVAISIQRPFRAFMVISITKHAGG
jgi:ubiquinone/menaquinone biosynthesis C-methylase UbiE